MATSIKPLSLSDEKIVDKLLAEPWDEDDWRDLFVAMETARRRIAARHAKRKLKESN